MSGPYRGTVRPRGGILYPSRLLGNDGVIGPSGSLTLTADTIYARYIGRAASPLSSIRVIAYVSGAAAVGAGWAEIAIATGDFTTPLANVTLTPRGYASIDTEVKAGLTSPYTKTITGLALSPVDDLWLLVACNYATTQATLRINAGDGDRSGAAPRAVAAGRPSTLIETATTYIYTPANGIVAMWAQM